MKFNKGQVQVVTVGITAGVTFLASWLGGYLLNSPVNSAKAVSTLETAVAVEHQINLTQDTDIKDLKNDVKHMRDILDTWAQRQGIIIKNQ